MSESLDNERAYAGGKILARRAGAIGTIVFNQPQKRNAMSVEMWGGVEAVLAEWEADAGVHAVVLTGAGDKAFVSGADISQFEKQRANADAQREYDRQIQGGRAKLATFPKPIIASIRGYCLGGGLAIAMQADIRIAAADAQFGIPAVRMGISYGFVPVSRLVDLVGPAHASMILLTGERIDAIEAERIGLVNRVVPVADLDPTVAWLAETIAAAAPLSVLANKQILANVTRDPADRDFEAMRAAAARCLNSHDYREGRTAFMEKRKPRFEGR